MVIANEHVVAHDVFTARDMDNAHDQGFHQGTSLAPEYMVVAYLRLKSDESLSGNTMKRLLRLASVLCTIITPDTITEADYRLRLATCIGDILTCVHLSQTRIAECRSVIDAKIATSTRDPMHAMSLASVMNEVTMWSAVSVLFAKLYAAEHASTAFLIAEISGDVAILGTYE